MSKNLFYQLAAGLALGLLLVLFGNIFFNKPYSFQGSLISPPVTASNFSLQSGDGTQFELSEQKGSIVLLYFGYTFCPDVCPTTLYEITKIKEKLGNQSEEIVVAMITVDPDRDTPSLLVDYVTTFDSSFYGLSGDIEALEVVWADYGIFRQKTKVESSAGYLVDHTARIFVVDQDGNLRLTFPFGMAWEAMADDLKHLLSEHSLQR